MILDNVKLLKNKRKDICINLGKIDEFISNKIGELPPTIEKVKHLFYETNKHNIVTIEEKKSKSDYTNSNNLEDRFRSKRARCREYSLLAQIVLAQIGIPTLFYSLSAKEKTSHRHDFLLYSKGGRTYVFDAYNHIMEEELGENKYHILDKDEYKYYHADEEYRIRYAEPININPDYDNFDQIKYGILFLVDDSTSDSDSKCCLVQ